MWSRRLSNVIGFDDAPFERASRAPEGERPRSSATADPAREGAVSPTRNRVALVGTVCSGTRLDIVVRGHVDRDGVDSTATMIQLVREKSLVHVRAVLLQGITVAGFNVVDVHALNRELGMPVLVVMRRRPRMELFFRAMSVVPGAEARRALVEAAGPPEALGGVWVQRIGLTRAEAERLLERTTVHGNIPEPLRLAHIIAGGVTTGKSRGRA
jgi:endonuclease V-like protein UPF0215 family